MCEGTHGLIKNYLRQTQAKVFEDHCRRPCGVPGGLRWWRICLQCRRLGLDPWVGKIPWRRKWQSSAVFLSGKSHGQRSLVGYSPWGHKESDTTEWLTHTHTHAHTHTRPCTSCMFKLKRGFFWRGITGSGHVLRMVSHRNRKGFGQAWDRRTRQSKFIYLFQVNLERQDCSDARTPFWAGERCGQRCAFMERVWQRSGGRGWQQWNPGGSPPSLSWSGPCPPSLKSTGAAHWCIRSIFGLSPWLLAQNSSISWDSRSDRVSFVFHKKPPLSPSEFMLMRWLNVGLLGSLRWDWSPERPRG